MPIKGLSDQVTLPRLGKIRLGAKVANSSGGGDHPVETEYFIVPEEVESRYGEKPMELDVMFPVDEIETVFPQWYKWYGSDQGLKCKGDGETAMRRYDLIKNKRDVVKPENEKDFVRIGCPCPMLDTKKCGPKASLMVILPEINLFGVYQIDTGSIYAIKGINSMIRVLQARFGRISMIPLKLKRVPVEMTHEGKKRTHYIPVLECHLKQEEVNALTGSWSASSLALSPPDDEDAPAIESAHEDGPDPISPTPFIEIEPEQVETPTNGNGHEEPARIEEPATPTPWIATDKAKPSRIALKKQLDVLGETMYKEIMKECFMDSHDDIQSEEQAMVLLAALRERGRELKQNAEPADMAARVDATP